MRPGGQNTVCVKDLCPAHPLSIPCSTRGQAGRGGPGCPQGQAVRSERISLVLLEPCAQAVPLGWAQLPRSVELAGDSVRPVVLMWAVRQEGGMEESLLCHLPAV